MTAMEEFTQHIYDHDVYELYIYEQLAAADPDFVEVLFPLAELYTHLGQYEKGLGVDKRLAQLYPDDCEVVYNLACSFSLCGKADEAVHILERAVSLGWDDVEHMESDEDFDNIRDHPRYSAVVEKLKENSL